uniref:MDL7 n=1 Tax=Mayetiola destructor TaxID=39758 RepID=A0A7S5SLE5_MAYDE|nr:MDL7 [Mayetiola destructor]
MFRVDILLFALSIVPISNAVYDELYRPQLHYSPAKGWLSDPNGLIYKEGIYHLFFQCRPDHIAQGSVHWGHSISSDLIHWKALDTALYPPVGHEMFSGGAIFDYKNVTKLQTNENVPALILLPSAAVWSTREQNIWLAYSNDGPEYNKFTYYEKNPVIRGPSSYGKLITAFRDLTVFKYHDNYVSILVQYNRTQFYSSHDLIDWELISEFGEYEGSHAGRWECPSLFPFNVSIDGKQVEKYVMIITLTDYVHPVHQYFIGSFDGKKFTNENTKETILWLEYGPDSFAGVTYNELPDGRRIFIHWMGRWEYVANLNFSPWLGQLGIPRELNLIKVGDQIRLTSEPVREMESLRINHVRRQNINITNEFSYQIADSAKKNHLADIELMLDLQNLDSRDAFQIVFSGKSDEFKIIFKEKEFILDRTRAGKIIPNFEGVKISQGNFDNPNFIRPTKERNFEDLWKAPRLIDSSNLKLRIIIDTNAIEMFADDGLTSMCALFFSKDGIASKMTIQVHSSTKKSHIYLRDMNVYEMKSIWHKDESTKSKFNFSDNKKQKIVK